MISNLDNGRKGFQGYYKGLTNIVLIISVLVLLVFYLLVPYCLGFGVAIYEILIASGYSMILNFELLL